LKRPFPVHFTLKVLHPFPAQSKQVSVLLIAPEEYKAQLARNILAKAHLLGVNVKSPAILEWAEK
jgi:hypothetical protein